MDDYVDSRDIETPRGDICSEEDGWGCRVDKAGEVLLADVCWVFPVKGDEVEVVVECRRENSGEIVDCGAGRDEANGFLGCGFDRGKHVSKGEEFVC